MKRRPSLLERARARALLRNPCGPPSLFVRIIGCEDPQRARIGKDKFISRRRGESASQFEARVSDSLPIGKAHMVIFFK